MPKMKSEWRVRKHRSLRFFGFPSKEEERIYGEQSFVCYVGDKGGSKKTPQPYS